MVVLNYGTKIRIREEDGQRCPIKKIEPWLHFFLVTSFKLFPVTDGGFLKGERGTIVLQNSPLYIEVIRH